MLKSYSLELIEAIRKAEMLFENKDLTMHAPILGSRLSYQKN